ncbi:MAG: Ig-like domain-containing protein, partial [Butyricicoccus pullicaecorum]|nr:Ig-like domain-containing protein [Butyricicoccus pullicaecorum]
HETHTDECGGLTGSCTFVCLEHTPQTLPELGTEEDAETPDTPEETPDAPEDGENPEEQPDVPPFETIPATPLTPAQPSEEMDSPDTEAATSMPTPRASDIVYTSATGGNQSHTGDGSYANPYNLFDDAVKNTMPGGTIIIKNKAFLNTLNETGSLPYIIDKDITIKSENPDNPAMLQVRAGGIVLGGDVTFEDVNLNFENRVHDAIFANGHTLTLKNVLRGNGSREVDLFGGQLYDKQSNQPYAADKKGSKGKIHIQMDDPKSAPYTSVHLGNIYAGSMNGSFDDDVEITIESKNANKFIGAVYASGAEEADPGSMLDIKEPAPPEANPKYAVSGTVTMNFDRLPLRSSPMLIDGNTGNSSGKTNLSISVSNLTSNLELKNISGLTVEEGIIQPNENSDNDFETITIKSGSELDLSKIPSVTTGTLSGAGTLTLKRDGLMNVTTTFEDKLTFQTEGAWSGASGIVNADHTYVTVPANSNGTFDFDPHQAQTGWTFEKDGTSWKSKKPAGSADLPIVTALSIDPTDAQQTIYENPPKSESPPYIPLQLQFESVDVTVSDIFYNSFTCSVKSPNSQTPIKFIHEDGDDDGYYYAEGKNFPFVLCIAEYDETALTIERASTPDNSGFQTIPLGNYEIEIGYPDKNGDMLTAKAYLTSVPNPPEITNPDASDSQITVKPSVSSVAFGGTVNVTADIQKATTLSSRAIEANNAYLYVNGKLVTQSGLTNPVNVAAASISFDNIAITPDNGFHAGQNQISVVYGGGDKITALGALKGSTGTANITVNKADPTVSVTNNSPITQTYNGSNVTYTPQNLTVTVPNLTISNPQFSVIYKKDGTALDQPPILPATYTTEIQVAEGDTYQAKTIAGPQIVIQKATPSIALSHTFAQNDKVILQATLQGVENGIVPTGTITFQVGQQAQSTEQPINYGMATLEIPKPSTGTHTIQATYKPSTGSADIYNTASAQSSLEIQSSHKPLTGIHLNTQTLVLKKDASAKLTVTFQPQDASNKKVTWTSNADNIVSVSQDGTVTAKSAGTATITALAEEGGHVASCTVTVSETDVPVQSVTINAPNKTLKVGETSQLSAIITPYNATARDVVWKSSSDSVSVDAGKITAVKQGSATITATVGGKSGTCEIQVTDTIPVTAIKLNSTQLSMKVSETTQLLVSITPDNATNTKVTWESSDSTFVEVDSNGWITAKKETTSPVTIKATTTDGSNKTATCQVTVTASTGTNVPVTGVSVLPKTLELDVAQEQQLSFEIQPMHATNKKVTWSSSSSDITVDQTGLVRAVKAGGHATITVTTEDGQKTDTCTVTVRGETPQPTISLTPEVLPLKVGGTGMFTAVLNNGNAQNIVWSIENDQQIIRITPASNKQTATVTADKVGQAIVKVSYTDSGIVVTDTSTVEVTDSSTPETPVEGVTIQNAPASLEKGKTHLLTATVLPAQANQSVTWSSETPATASVNPTTGEVTAIAAGQAVITATSVGEPKKTAQVTITITDSTKPDIPVQSVSIDQGHLSLKPNEKSKFTATVLPAQANQAVTWTSNAPSIVSIDPNTGELTALKAGQATITAASVSSPDKTDSKIVTVIEVPITSLKINESILSLREGRSAQLTVQIAPDNATDTTVIWTSDNENVMSVTQNGYITAHNKGVATITATSAVQPEMKDSRTISVTAPSSGGGGSSGGGSSSGGSSNKPSKPDSKPDTKPEVPPTVTPEPPKAGVPIVDTAPPVNSAIDTNFADIPQTHWASEPIQDVVSRGLFVGTAPNTFSPNESMSRSMVVTVLYR